MFVLALSLCLACSGIGVYLLFGFHVNCLGCVCSYMLACFACFTWLLACFAPVTAAAVVRFILLPRGERAAG